MKKLLLTTLVLLSLSTVSIFAQTTTDSEPTNNTVPGDSMAVPMNNTAALSSSVDVDFYKIRTNKIGVMVVSVTGTNNNMTTKVQILNSDGVSLEAYRDASFSSEDITLEFLTQYTGIYYIRIQNIRVTTLSSPYNLKVSMDTSDVYEYNNNISNLSSVTPINVSLNEAAPTTINAKIRGFYYVNNGGNYNFTSLVPDQDYYRFNTGKNTGALVMRLTNAASNLRFRIEVIKDDGNTVLGYRDANFNGDSVRFELLTQYGGEYYVRLRNINGISNTAGNTSPNNYTFTIALDTSGGEFNDIITLVSSKTALPVSMNENNPTQIKGKIRGYYYVNNGGNFDFSGLTPDQDYYKITTGKNKGALVMRLGTVPSNLKFRIEVLKDDANTVLGYRDAAFNGDTLRFELLTQYAGVYYIRLRNVNGQSNGLQNSSASQYNLSVSLDTLGNEFNDFLSSVMASTAVPVNFNEKNPTTINGKIRGYYYVNNGGNFDFSVLTPDQDYYKITTGKNMGVLVMKLSSVPSNLKFRIEMIKDDGTTLLGYRDAGVNGDTMRFELLTQYAGVYYVRIRNVNGTSNGTGNSSALPYVFNISMDTLGREFNDNISNVTSQTPISISSNEAIPTTLSGKIRGYYYVNNGGNYDFANLTADQDIYKISTPSKVGVLIGRLSNVPVNLRFRIEYLKDDAVTVLGFKDGLLNGDTMRFELLTQYGGVYYVRIRNVNGVTNVNGNTSSTPYTLKLAYEVLNDEFNDLIAAATSLNVNDSTYAKIRGHYRTNFGAASGADFTVLTPDVDIYKTNTGCYHFVDASVSNVPLNMRMKITAYDTTGTIVLGSKTASLNGERVVLTSANLSKNNVVRYFRVENVNSGNETNTSPANYLFKTTYKDSIYAPIISPGGPLNVCKGQSVTLTSNTSGNNFWSTGEFTKSINYPVTKTGYVTLRNDFTGCYSGVDTVFINMLTIPLPSFTYVANLKAVTFTNTTFGGTTYKWFFGDNTSSTQANPVNNYKTNGEYTVTLIATNSCGVDSIKQIITVGPSGIKNQSSQLKALVLPNPNNGSFVVQLKNPLVGAGSLQVINASGQIVHSTLVNAGSTQIPMHLQLPAGVYSVIIDGSQQRFIERFVIGN